MSNVAEHLRNRNYPMAAVEACPTPAFKHIYNAHTDGDTHLSRRDGQWTVTIDGDDIHLRRAKDALRLTHIGETPRQRCREKYTLDGFADVYAGDRVVDVGPYLGEFSLQVRDTAASVTAVEPDPGTAAICEANGIETYQVAAYCADTTREFNRAVDPSESSLLAPDASPTLLTIDVQTARLDTLFDAVEFVKIDAEGAEPEVVAGMHDLDVRAVAVDCEPERYSESPAPLVRAMLEAQGFETRQQDAVVFGRQ